MDFNCKKFIKPKSIIILIALLALSFHAAIASAANSTPKAVSLSPSAGRSDPNQAITFTTAFLDADGFQNLLYGCIQFTGVDGRVVWGYYDTGGNKLFLTENGSTWLGGYAPGSANIIENTYAKIDCSKTSVTKSGSYLIVRWNIVFKTAFAHTLVKNVYLYAKDKTGANTGWVLKGNWLIGTNSPPYIGIVSPSSGSVLPNTPMTFASYYYDPNGWQDLRYGYIVINTSTSAANCFFGYYDVALNKLYIAAGNGASLIGGIEPGAKNADGTDIIIDNTYVKLNCTKTAVFRSGTVLLIKWNVTFQQPFAGSAVKNIYLNTGDYSYIGTGYIQKGIFLVGPNTKPAVQSILPSSGSGTTASAQEFVSSFQDANGWTDIRQVWIYFRPLSTFSGYMFHAYYDQNSNKLYVLNDTATAFLGGYSPGSNFVIENSKFKLDCSKTLVSGDGTTMTIKWNFTFKVACNFESYLYVKDESFGYDGFKNVGSWTVYPADTVPPTGTIKINNDNQWTKSLSAVLTLSAQDNEGGSGLSQMQFSNDGSAWSAPEAHAGIKTWNMSPGDGQKTVRARFRDTAGNWSGIYSDTITLDTIPPVVVITSPQDNALVNTASINVQYTVDGTAKSKQVNLANEGPNTVTITETDAAGNTASSSITVRRDTVPPVVVITSPARDAVFDVQNITVQYTLDGVARSKDVNLPIVGANTVTISDSDAAGNAASAQILVYYNPGTPIDPGSDETIVSPDGQASVEVPAGAVGSSVPISVTNLNPNNYDNAAPQDYDTQGVATFGPDGTTFTKPVTIKMPLDKSEIPGTEIDLGLLNRTSGNFELTSGQKMVVNADGRSASAQVTHFSTYGALKNLVSTGAPIGGGAEIPLPDLFTGAFSHQIKIVTPPGRKGMEPNLALLYKSTLRNGWLGYGWDLNPGCIERDLKAGAPSYKDTSETLDLGDGSDGELNVTSGTTVINGTKNYTRVYIGKDATVTCDGWNGSTGGEIIIKCQGEVKVEGALTVNGKGYRGGVGGPWRTGGMQGESYTSVGGRSTSNNEGGGGGGRGSIENQWQGSPGAGGGYKTAGESVGSVAIGGVLYGDAEITTLYKGSGGGGGGDDGAGNSGGNGGNGGGAINIAAKKITVTVDGSIKADGDNGSAAGQYNNVGGGSGSGGSILVMAEENDVSGKVTANGGSRVADGGKGGEGRIKVISTKRLDTFIFSSTGSRMDLVNLIDNLYQSKIEAGFVKFYKEADGSWLAVQKDGTKMYFGTTAGSRITTAKGTVKWLLDKIEDTNGNYLTLSYSKDSGAAYLARISYTGNSTTNFLPTHTVDFILEDRDDKIYSNSYGETITTAKRLKEIRAMVNTGLARKYIFNYTYSLATNRSLLTSIDQYGSDGTTKSPMMTFKYRGK